LNLILIVILAVISKFRRKYFQAQTNLIFRKSFILEKESSNISFSH
jgi:hypothetical protein